MALGINIVPLHLNVDPEVSTFLVELYFEPYFLARDPVKPRLVCDAVAGHQAQVSQKL